MMHGDSLADADRSFLRELQMAEQLGGGWRRKWEAVLRYITRRKAGVKLLLLLLSCRSSLASSGTTLRACGYGVAVGGGRAVCRRWTGRSEAP